MDASESQRFSEELHWCIRQLELGLDHLSPDSRQASEAVKILKILRSSKAPLVKKRQAMRNALGDYRKKMKAEEKKSKSAMKRARFQSGYSSAFSKSRFYRQSHTKELSKETLNSNMNNLHIEVKVPEREMSLNEPNFPAQSSVSTSAQNDSTNCDCYDLPASFSALPSPSASDSGPMFSKNRTLYKFLPSDNSFCFNFEDNLDDLELPACENEKKESEVFKAYSNEVKNSSHNYFKLIKSENEFAFDFDCPVEEES